MFKFVLPVSKKEVEWKPLSYQQELDIVGAHRRDELKHLLDSALICARIIKFGDKPMCQPGDLGVLDAFDVECLAEDIQNRENERKSMLLGKTLSSNAEQLAASIEQLKILASQMGACLSSAHAQIKAAEAKGSVPLV